MTLVVTHPFVSPKPQGGDSTRVYGPQWNANHTLTGTTDSTQLNANVVQAVVNDTNIQGSIASQTLTFSWGGTLAAARLNANVVQAITNDTNVTGTISAQNLTLGWTGQLGLARGGTNANLSATGGSQQYLKQAGVGSAVTVGTIPASDIASGAALTKGNDTNVTLTLGGTPATSLLAATSITAGWTGTLAAGRGGFGADVSAQSGVPLFAAGTPTFTGTTGSANFVQATSPTITTPIIAEIDGGSAAGSTIIIKSTTSGSPSGDTATVQASSVILRAASGGTILNVGVSNVSGAAINVAGSSSGSQQWVTQAAASGTITFPSGSGTLALLASPTFTGVPAAPTATVGTNTTQLATTAFVIANAASAGVASIAGNTGAFTLAGGVTNSTNQIQHDGNYSGWGLMNCTLAASVASNILTVALKDNTGADPSATSPAYINYRNVTAATGSTSLVSQTAALSITTNATGATLGSSNSTAFRFWVVVFNNGGTNVLALINCSNSTTIFPLNEGAVASSTAISASATSAGVFYTPNGTTVTSKAFRILGYVEYNSTGLATAGTYATGPNFIQTFGPGIHKPGDRVQFLYTSTTTAGTTASATFVALSTGITLAITPSSAANPIRVESYGPINNGSTAVSTTQLSRGTTAATNLFGAQGFFNGAAGGASISMFGIDLPNTTSSTTYAVQGKATAGSLSYPLGGDTGTLSIEEIMG